MVGIAEDITERKRSEEALRKSEEKYRELVENANSAIIRYESDGAITFFNEYAQNFFGYREEEIIGKNIGILVPKQDSLGADLTTLVQDIVSHPERHVQRINENICSDGRRVWMAWTNKAVVTEGGNVAEILTVGTDITERKQAEDALRERDARFQLILKNAGTVVFAQNRELVYTEIFNPNQHLTIAMVVGSKDEDLFSGEDAQRLTKIKSGVLETGEPACEEVLLTLGGNQFIYLLNVDPVFGKTGEVEGICCAATDITRRELSEAALRHRTEELQLILDTVPATIWFKDKDNNILRVNKAACDMMGLPATGIENKHASEIFPGWLAEKYYRDDLEVISSGKPGMGIEEQIINAAGELRWVNTDKVPWFDAKGNLAGVLAFVVDVTERKRTEREREKLQSALVAASNRIALHVRQTPLGIIEFECDGAICEWNPAAEKIFGYSRQEAVGRHWRFLVPAENLEQMGEVWNSVVTGCSNSSSVSENRTQEGRLIICDWLNTKLVDSNGRVIGVASFVQDITERKMAEQERERLQSQLLQAQKLESVGRLAGGVAHDFNNMLGVILGHSELALEKIEPGHPACHDLLEIAAAANRSANLVRQLLAFARKQTIVPRVLNLDEAVGSVLNMIQRLIGENIRLNWEPGEGVWPVRMDPTQVDQILANLCVNARDAIAGIGGINIETGNTSIDENYCMRRLDASPGEYVVLSVQDDGAGMEDKTLARLFEPFFTTKEVGKGTGLGLSTVYGIVRQNGGFIDVDSKPGRGTTFRIHLPRTDAPHSQPRPGEPSLVSHKGTETILLVEDEISILELGKSILERCGYKVLTANAPEEALKLAKNYSSRIDLLITDLIMPTMNGKDLAEKLSEIVPGLHNLFMSGYTGEALAESGVVSERIYFLQKPFSLKTLTAKVREVLRK